jgi:hypothetical protein
MKNFWEWRNNFMVNNPNTSGVMAFIKGVILTIIIYEYLLS